MPLVRSSNKSKKAKRMTSQRWRCARLWDMTDEREWTGNRKGSGPTGWFIVL